MREGVDIIIPIYNSEKYLSRCIESALAQTYEKIWIILVDDGSTDSSLNVANQYVREFANINVIHKKNGGAISARMTGISVSENPYIMFLDSDDWTEPDLVKRLITPMLNNEEIGVSVCPYVLNTGWSERCCFETEEEQMLSAETALLKMFQNKIFNWSSCGRIYRKENVLPFCDTWWTMCSHGEDTEWNWKVLHNVKYVYYQPFLGYHYYENYESMTHNIFSCERMAYLDRMDLILTEMGGEQTDLQKQIIKLTAQFCLTSIAAMIQCEENYVSHIERCRDRLRCMEKNGYEPVLRWEKQYLEFARLSFDEEKCWVIEGRNAIISTWKRFSESGRSIYVYGAGTIAKTVSRILELGHCDFAGFVVSQKEEGQVFFYGYPVYSLEEVECLKNEKSAYILALNMRNEKEVEEILRQKGIGWYQSVGMYTLNY